MSGLHAVFDRVANRRGLWAMLGWMLLPLSLLFRMVVALRRNLYEWGVLGSRRIEPVVVSVGNIEVGGTGKTPVVIWLARQLTENGLTVAVVARDLSRRTGPPRRIKPGVAGTRKPSDEALLLAHKLEGICPVFAGPDKTLAAERAALEQSPQVVLVDDGFQHLKLVRDLDLVVAAFSHPLGVGGLLPAGTLREPPGALSRAHWLWISGMPEGRSSGWVKRMLGAYNWKAGIVESSTGPCGYVDREGKRIGAMGGPALAFCGIGRPEGFMETLERDGQNVVDKVVYPDHHVYCRKDMKELRKRAAASGASWLATTEKDMIKVALLPEPGIPVLALEVSLDVRGAQGLLEEILELSRRSERKSLN